MRIGNVIYWTMVIFLGTAFLLVGTNKIMAAEAWQQRFATQWGLPAWMALVTGIAEVVGGLMVLYPRTTPVGAALLALVMLGATVTHVLAGEWSNVPVTVVLLVLAKQVALRSWKRVGARSAGGIGQES